MSAVEALLAGPRGRRLLLEYALLAEQHSGAHSEDSLHTAVFLASYHLDVDLGSGVVMFGPGADEARRTVVTADDVAYRLSRVQLPKVTATALRSALALSVDFARYWQPPDGQDVLAATESVRTELRRIAEHVAASPHTQWWWTGLVTTDQWMVGWENPDAGFPDDSSAPSTAELLRDYAVRTVEQEERAARERPTDPSAAYGGQWWSCPPTRSSTRLLSDGTPSELWFVEDGMGWERAVSRRLHVPEGVRVYEVDGAQAWAELCRRFPVTVTAQKRHDWYNTTGRDGRWVMPDWQLVAEHYDGVHLTVGGYLVAAGTAIGVDDDTASVIAGWAPDETYWLTDAATSDSGSARVWLCDNNGEHPVWTEERPCPA
ncbi:MULTISPECIES: hypothetical protein [Nocardiaceae]|uniref:Uncharacterized protein n=1 Tax=Rhodococcoides corynebacterioides TaxID=53972 RepID=A0ABS2KWB3_9NOCA|nr:MULTISPECIES: hypothetical protein [Rhodococcus]MBM7415561.1 hypothetical protein [Rhodococcus corynebacterioides]MBP1118023.1 hypothetical protein [Rhodococcus sp. PvP016]